MKKSFMLFAFMAMFVLSAFDSPPKSNLKEEMKLEAKILIAPNQDVFTTTAQQFMIITLNRALYPEDHPCSGACVCDNWTASGGGYYRACGCYTWGFWYEYKPCYYCVPQPNYGSTCQNG